MRGEKLTFSAIEYVYFLTRLPFCGRALAIDPHLSGEDQVETMVACHCSGSNPMLGSVVCIEAIDDLLTEFITAMVVRMYGSLGTQQIIGGKLKVAEEVMDGDLFASGVSMHTKIMSQLNQCRRAKSGDFVFGFLLMACILERVPLLHSRILPEPAGRRDLQLMRWAHVLACHGSGEGGHYFMPTVARVWCHML